MPDDAKGGTGSGSGGTPAVRAQQTKSDGDGKILIPAWAVRLLQWSGPAIIAVVAAYFKIQYIELDVTDLKAAMTVKDATLNQFRNEITILQERQNGSTERINLALTNINDQLKTLNTELSNLRTLMMRLTTPRSTPP